VQPQPLEDHDANDLRLFLEDICCEMCRFDESASGLDPGQVRIDREVRLAPEAFADIRVQVPGKLPYYFEVKYGYPPAAILRSLKRKYGAMQPDGCDRIIMLVDEPGAVVEADVRAALHVPLVVWREHDLLRHVGECFGIQLTSLSTGSLQDLRTQVDRAQGFAAFGGPSLSDYVHDHLRSSLLWHFAFWRLGQLREQYGLADRDMLSPGRYQKVVVLLADLCSFSAFVRDTPDPQIVRHMLTDFYTKARHQVVNRGGMLSQFVGDEVVAYFGLPDQHPSAAFDAWETALALVDIGEAVAHEWQRSIDHVELTGGVHIGMAMGDLEVFPQRSFSRTHMGQVGDAINMAARLMNMAGPSEIVMTNLLYRQLQDTIDPLEEQEPVDAKNIGRIKSWKHRRA
jgi:class 3 adenylate cyclase